MGMLRRMKYRKDTVAAAPDIAALAYRLAAQAQPGAGAGGFPFNAIADVSLDQFVAVSKGVAAYDHDQSKLTDVAAGHGIDSFTWEQAARGWNERIKANPAVAQRFNQLYQAG
jgi:hypothetical protein